MNTKEKGFEKEIIPFLSQGIKCIVGQLDPRLIPTLEEIRLRADKPMMIQNGESDWFVTKAGQLTQNAEGLFTVPREEIIKTLELMSENSVYAFQDEIKNGFITLKGGHRVGIAGKIVLDGNQVKNIKDVSGMNIRISKEVPGCASKIMEFIFNCDGSVWNTLIISPPGCGKTTLLRDIARVISNGQPQLNFHGLKVGIVDERSEIAACYKGVGQNETGVRTDVLDGCPKALGMTMMIRSMSPQVIITDEIGNQGDKEAILRLMNAGVKIITSAHGYSLSELKTRQEIFGLLQEKIFDRYAVLSKAAGPGTLEEVIEGEQMKSIYRRTGYVI